MQFSPLRPTLSPHGLQVIRDTHKQINGLEKTTRPAFFSTNCELIHTIQMTVPTVRPTLTPLINYDIIIIIIR